ncbi:hypothetical protein JL722_11580 [Aureococcus anophagefferens]|nr:hypothetical protein JL722_11580 [Aureococcus anophagefferens]
MANLRAIGEACVLPDDYGYIRRNLGAALRQRGRLPRTHRRPFREAVAAMTAAIESIVADMDVMGAAISRSGGVNATKGPDATPSSATVRAMHAQLLLLDDAFAELVHGGETGLTAAQLDASTSMLDVVTTHAERFNAQQRQAQVVVVLAPASAYYDHCFVCRRRVATLWRCAHCVKSLCREHAKAADDGPPSASWTCGKAHSAAAKRDFAEHRREIQDRWSLYQITGRGGVGLYRMRVGPPSTLSSRGDDGDGGGDDDDDADTLYFLGREPGGKDHPHGAPERARLPGPHAKRVADFVAAALHVDDDDDDDEEEEEEGEGDDGDDDDDDDDDDEVRARRRSPAAAAAAPSPADARAHLRRSCNTEARVT